MLLPSKKSFYWIYIQAGIFAINAAALLISRVLLNIEIDIKNIIGFVLVSLLISIIVLIGYFGIRMFSYVFIIFDFLGLFYMYFIILSNKSGGWVDITSIIDFIVFVGFGIIVGIITEFIYWVIKHNKKTSL